MQLFQNDCLWYSLLQSFFLTVESKDCLSIPPDIWRWKKQSEDAKKRPLCNNGVLMSAQNLKQYLTGNQIILIVTPHLTIFSTQPLLPVYHFLMVVDTINDFHT